MKVKETKNNKSTTNLKQAVQQVHKKSTKKIDQI